MLKQRIYKVTEEKDRGALLVDPLKICIVTNEWFQRLM